MIDGRRAAPPEDCGGVTDAEDLAEVLDDPGYFDLEETNEALRNPYFILREYGAAGHLKPADVEAASRVVPSMSDWIGKNSRESLAGPLLDLRQTLPSMRLDRDSARWLQAGGVEHTNRTGSSPSTITGSRRHVTDDRPVPGVGWD